MDEYIDNTYSWTTCDPYVWDMTVWDCTLSAFADNTVGKMWADCNTNFGGGDYFDGFNGFCGTFFNCQDPEYLAYWQAYDQTTVTDPTNVPATRDGARGYTDGTASNWLGTKEIHRYLWNVDDPLLANAANDANDLFNDATMNPFLPNSVYCDSNGDDFVLNSETAEIEDEWELRFHEDCRTTAHTDIILIMQDLSENDVDDMPTAFGSFG